MVVQIYAPVTFNFRECRNKVFKWLMISNTTIQFHLICKTIRLGLNAIIISPSISCPIKAITLYLVEELDVPLTNSNY